MSYFDDLKERFPVLIPYWIEKQLRRKQLPLDTVFDLNKLSELCSSEDIAIMIAMNAQHSAAFYGVSYQGQGIVSHWSNFYQPKFVQIEPLTKIYAAQIDARLTSQQMCWIKQGGKSILDTVSLATTQYSEPFTITPIQPAEYPHRYAALAIVIYPGYFGGQEFRGHQLNLVRAYLRQSYVFCDYDVVARSPLFAQYMRTSIVEPA